MGKTHGVARFDSVDDETFYGRAQQIYQVYNVENLTELEEEARNSIFKKSDKTFIKNREKIIGYDFNNGINYDLLFNSFLQQGFQATNFGQAIDIINLMIKEKKDNNCRIFFGYTSNMISCGNREIIRYLVEHKKIDCIVTTAGGIEEDFIKCFASTYNGDFHLNGIDLRKKAISRIGNLLIPNDNYSLFETFLIPILNNMLKQQNNNHINWTPSKMIEFMGKEINNKQSVYYWAYMNNIPVFCPAITDGSIGDLFFFHSLKNPGLKIDIVEDIQKLNFLALNSSMTGCFILGGGIIKHHILNANAMRSGADYVVVINTAMEYDGSDSGANLDEAVSWAKIRTNAKTVKVVGDASLLFPLIVSRTFAQSDSINDKQNLE